MQAAFFTSYSPSYCFLKVVKSIDIYLDRILSRSSWRVTCHEKIYPQDLNGFTTDVRNFIVFFLFFGLYGFTSHINKLGKDKKSRFCLMQGNQLLQVPHGGWVERKDSLQLARIYNSTWRLKDFHHVTWSLKNGYLITCFTDFKR